MDVKSLLAASVSLAAVFTPLPASATPWERANHTLPTAVTAPQIDGILSDPCWQQAFRVREFVRFTGGAPVVEATEAWATADSKALYVAFYCHDTHPELLRASETQRGSNAVEGDDHVSVVIDSQHLHRGTSSFSVNALGTQVEHLEGGTADNITWAGDWKAVSRRVDDGWICEIAIPFSLLRHPARSRTFGLQLARSLARESNQMVWPALPPEGQSFSTRAQFLPDIQLAQPMPDVAPRPVFLPYTLSTAATNGARARQGLDAKYPFSTTLTGLLALSPDFQTIEQDVASVNFSYNEQFVADRRPFFAEGNEFLPDRELFYSRRIRQFDAGTKVVGRQGTTAVGFVAATARTGELDRDSMALSLRQSVGLFSDYGLSATSDNRQGALSNRVVRAYGSYGWLAGDRRNNIFVHRSQSWQGGIQKGISSELSLSSRANNGKLRYYLSHSQLSADFISDLGLTQDRDRQGWFFSTGLHNQFDRGPVYAYDLNLDYSHADRLTSKAFFFENTSVYASAQTRTGLGLSADASQGRRQPDTATYYQDQVAGIGLGWNQRQLFQGGGLRLGRGRQGGLPTQSFSLSQGALLARPLSLRASLNQQKRGDTTTRQTVLTGTLRLDSLRTISGRLISQNGIGNKATVGAQTGTNFYFAYAQRSRSGADIFVLLGDPNAANTQTQVTLKLVRPY